MSLYSDIPGPDTSPATHDGSFQPVDLAGAISGSVQQPTPTMLTRQGDGIESGLIYPGVVNGLHGDSGTGKSWLALLLLAERIKDGENVMLIDLEDTPASIVTRLRLLGIADNELVEQLAYIQPTEAFGPLEVEHLINLIDERSITVVVIDSLGEAFGTEGIDEDRDKDVGPWLRSVARPLAKAGPAVLLIDHSTKSKERQLHASGSKRKRAAIGGASYLVEAATGFAKGKSGRLKSSAPRTGTAPTGAANTSPGST
jgi:RecA-family ATPase